MPGSGALGIEALSRGAAAAVLVEKQAAAMAVIRQNLRAARCEAGATLLQMDSLAALSRLREPFSFIFLDPPYAAGFYRPAMPGDPGAGTSRARRKDLLPSMTAAWRFRKDFPRPGAKNMAKPIFPI